MDEGGSREGSEDEEPELLPDVIDEEFINGLNKSLISFKEKLIRNGDIQNSENVLKMVQLFRQFKAENGQFKSRLEEVETELNECKEKLQTAIEVSKLDQESIGRLRIYTENAWKQVDAAHLREQVVQEEMNKFRDKYEELKSLTQELTEKKKSRDDFLGVATADNENLLKERDKLANQIKELNKRLQIQRGYTSEVEQQCTALEDKAKALYQLLDATSIEGFKDKKRGDLIAKELEEVKETRKFLEDKVQNLKDHNETLTKNNIQQSLQLLAAKAHLEQVNTKCNALMNRILKSSSELEQTINARDKLQKDLVQKGNLLKNKEEESIRSKQEAATIAKANEVLIKKTLGIQHAKNKAEHEMARMKAQLNAQEKELSGLKRTIESYQKKLKNLTKERDLLKQDLSASLTNVQVREEKFNIAEQEIRTFKSDLKEWSIKEKKFVDEISKIRKEADRYLEQIETLEDKIDLFKTDVQLKEDLVGEFKKNIFDLQGKISQLQNSLDTALHEKTIAQRNLNHTIKEKNDLKEQLKNSNDYNEALKEKCATKESEVGKLEFQVDRMEKERTQLRTDLKNFQIILQNIKTELIEKRQENANLYKTIIEDENRYKKLQKSNQELLHEKTLLGSQVKKHLEEIDSLNQTIQSTQAELDRLNKQYDQRIDDIRLLRIEIQNLRSEQDILKKDRENAADNRRELLRVHRTLNQERVKSRALQDEMLTPMNVHRWRALSGRDPEKMELLVKVQGLQKRVLAQNVTVTEKENALQQTYRLYESLKEFMIKLPSYKTKQELNNAKFALGVREKKLKALAAELNAKEVDEKAKDCVVDALRANLENTRRELTKERKRKQKLLEERQTITQQVQVVQMQCYSAPASASMTKTLGGGFRMSATN